jgi:hypothetical protein
MALTLQTVEAHIRNALGGDSSVEGNGRSIANQAGHYLASMHDWRCMERLGRLNLRATITITSATWTESSLMILAATAIFADYVWVEGDEVEVTGGTGATLGFYRIASRVSTMAITLDTSIGSGATTVLGTVTLDSMELPDDFRQLIVDPIASESTRTLTMVTAQELLEIRSGVSGSGFDTGYFGAILWNTSTATNGAHPTPRLEIWPAPGDDVLGAFRIHYRADWVDLSDDADTVPLPSLFGMEFLYLQIVRAVALGYEEFDMASMQARLMEVRGGPEFAAAVRSDGSMQAGYGQMRGGAAGMRSSPSYSFTFQPPS